MGNFIGFCQRANCCVYFDNFWLGSTDYLLPVLFLTNSFYQVEILVYLNYCKSAVCINQLLLEDVHTNIYS